MRLVAAHRDAGFGGGAYCRVRWPRFGQLLHGDRIWPHPGRRGAELRRGMRRRLPNHARALRRGQEDHPLRELRAGHRVHDQRRKQQRGIARLSSRWPPNAAISLGARSSRSAPAHRHPARERSRRRPRSRAGWIHAWPLSPRRSLAQQRSHDRPRRWRDRKARYAAALPSGDRAFERSGRLVLAREPDPRLGRSLRRQSVSVPVTSRSPTS